jgi:hypothetical protein
MQMANCSCVTGRQVRRWIQKLNACAKTRAGQRQGARSEFNLTIFGGTDFLPDLLEMQMGPCHYSDIPMTFLREADWSLSIERLDNARGYTRDNVCLVCVEFNTSAQWSENKFKHFLAHIDRKSEDHGTSDQCDVVDVENSNEPSQSMVA